jgi:hypothetical protein
MNQKSIVLVVVLFILIVVGMFVYAQLKKAELSEVVVAPNEEPAAPVPYADITRIDARHYFIDGMHTLVGEVIMPTPCDLLETKATIMESFPEQVLIDFTVVNTAENCIQMVTAQRFKVDFAASAEASIRAQFVGRNVELNLTPAAAGERPEDFELFIKG